MLIPLMIVRDQPLQQQLYDQLRGLITTRRLAPGARMPSSRMLAEQFSISRVTVLLTYERLIAEGLLETLPAKGTFVAHAAERPAGPARLTVPAEPARRAETIAHARVGRPDASLFPAGRWRALMRGALDHLGAQIWAEHPAGNPALRAAIASWLSVSRGLAVSPEQVLLVNSRQQALTVAAHLTLGPGARAVVEDPCDADAAATLASGGGTLLRVPVDADGLRPECLPEGGAALVHVTPEHQRPLGVSLTRARRIALLDWAGRAGALVLEEDCDGELRYGEMNVPSLMSLDTAERVILLSGFCTSLGPWLGLAYMVLPRRLVSAAATVRRLIDDSHGSLEETALAELLAGGGYALHLHRVCKAYVSRRDALLAALREQFGPDLRIWGEQSGLHLAWFPPAEIGSARDLAAVARRCGLEAASLAAGAGATLPDGQPVLLGFGVLAERQIAQRVAQFAAMAREGAPGALLSAN